MENNTELFEKINGFVQQGRMKNVQEEVSAALNSGIAAKDILDGALMPGMSVVGEKFKNNQIFVPEVLIAARAMNAGIEILKPKLQAGESQTVGRAVLGTVKGDHHDIGKNLVKIMFEAKGIEVIDLGVDVPPEKYVQSAIKENAQIIGCSALLTTTMGVMENVVSAANKEGILGNIKIMVGGAPLTGAFAKSIGADFYSEDAAAAADIALKICEGTI